MNNNQAVFLFEKYFRFNLTTVLFAVFVIQIFAPLALKAQTDRNRQLEREKTSNTKTVSNENRTALVIGNSTYQTSPLTNPANDATDMAAALKDLNFEVISGVNQNRAEMIRLIRQFGERLKQRGGVGLFYYAGHGVQVEGRNYLIPTDAAIRSENEVELEAVDVSRALVEMENAGNALNIVIMDACRNNPFSRSWRSTNDGLAQINAPSGTMIAYSTAPGKVASDGAGRNAPYTAALLKALKTPDLSLSDVFMQVRADVLQATNRQQTPWEASSVTGRFYFKQSASGGAETTKRTETQTVSDAQIEQEYWDNVKDNKTAADFQGYLKEYPNGRFAALARLKITQYEKTTPTNPTSNNTTANRTAGAISKAKFSNGAEMSFAYIPAGEFQMGDSNNGPIHAVKIRQGFFIGQTEVTQAQWQAVMGNNPSRFKGDNLPVESVSWEDAQQFISKLNAQNDGYKYRLPTEAEWEYAARAGTTGDYAGNLDAMAWYYNNAGDQTLSGEWNADKRKSNNNRTHEVGTKQANAWGLYDMHGNVWEWCQDWYDATYYAKSPMSDPTGATTGSYRVDRGGSWAGDAAYLRSALRYYFAPSDRNDDLGFRVVRN